MHPLMLEPGRLIGVRNLPAPYGPKELRMDFENLLTAPAGLCSPHNHWPCVKAINNFLPNIF